MVIDRNKIHEVLDQAVPFGTQSKIAATLGITTRQLRRLQHGEGSPEGVIDALRRLGYTINETVEVVGHYMNPFDEVKQTL